MNYYDENDPNSRIRNNYRRRKRKNRLHAVLAVFVITLLILIMLLILALVILSTNHEPSAPPLLPFQEFLTEADREKDTEAAEALSETIQEQTEIESQAQTEAVQGIPGTRKALSDLEETDIYTFMQGPKAWKSKVDFSGSWCSEVLADQEFSVFGCGLCVLANIYSTLTPCDCSPLDMFYYAREVSGYSPVSGFGAIDWPYMRQTLKTTGITAKLRRKPSDYARFQKAVSESLCTVALISSYYDDTYWHDVEGHYVTIWLYNSEDDTVFLSDSGNPDHNRQRIPLRYIYDALKKASQYHYMIVTDVDENGNTWGHDGINIRWKKPRYYKTMGEVI